MPSRRPLGADTNASPPTSPPTPSRTRTTRLIVRTRGTRTSWRSRRRLPRGCDAAGVTFDLQRFVDAQSQTYDQALAELRAGAKRTHWMWFVFPQIAGLGRSGMAQRFAIPGLEEARAYLGHPPLARRLAEGARTPTPPDP